MFSPQPRTEEMVGKFEQFARKKFKYHREIALLFEMSESASMKQAFDDLTFFAKFVSNASSILKRMGSSSEETVKLTSEFKDKIETVSILLSTLIQKAPDDDRENFSKMFLSLSHTSMDNLLTLLSELAWVKNYILDKKEPL